MLFRSYGKCFLFQLKALSVFVLAFWAIRNNDLIRKIRLTSKFMTSQPGQQRITIHILLNISRIKGNQTMQFGQLIELTREIFFFKNQSEMWVTVFVSATRRRRDIKILLCLTTPMRKSFIVSKDHGRTHNCNFSTTDREYPF